MPPETNTWRSAKCHPEERLLQKAGLALGRMEGGAVAPEGFLQVSVEHISRDFTDPMPVLGSQLAPGREDQTLASVICSLAVTPL